MNHLETLNSAEEAQLLDAIPLITVLIAGADGNIDEEERKWAEKLTDIRSYANREAFKEFYEAAHTRQRARLAELIHELPKDTSLRNQAISAELAKLNDILPKLGDHASKMYKGLVSFAHQVAEASGGILRFMTVSEAEQKWINLPMLTPIIDADEEETEEA